MSLQPRTPLFPSASAFGKRGPNCGKCTVVPKEISLCREREKEREEVVETENCEKKLRKKYNERSCWIAALNVTGSFRDDRFSGTWERSRDRSCSIFHHPRSRPPRVRATKYVGRKGVERFSVSHAQHLRGPSVCQSLYHVYARSRLQKRRGRRHRN